MTVAINEIVKNPRLLSSNDEIIYVEDRRKHELKSIVIPAIYQKEIEEAIRKIEYKIWLKRNREGLENPDFLDNVIEELGERIED